MSDLKTDEALLLESINCVVAECIRRKAASNIEHLENEYNTKEEYENAIVDESERIMGRLIEKLED